MKQETEVAAGYWLEQLRFNLLSNEQQQIFVDTLLKEMRNKFQNHWYEKDPVRGQGYRCVVYDCSTKYIDPMLVKAATAAKIDFVKFYDCSAYNKGIRMWIDPGEVEIESVVTPINRKLIFRKGRYSPQPEEMLEQGMFYNSLPDFGIYYPNPINPYEPEEVSYPYYNYYPTAYDQRMSDYDKYWGNRNVIYEHVYPGVHV